MNTYLLLKWVHILSSIVLVGTGFGSAFYMYFTLRTRNIEAIATVSKLVVRADWWFTSPTIIIQPVTGFILIYLLGYQLSFIWISMTLLLYVLAGLCWVPVVYLQIKMKQMARHSVETGKALPEQFWRYAKYWEWLGYPAFLAMIAIYWLMVFKPV